MPAICTFQTTVFTWSLTRPAPFFCFFFWGRFARIKWQKTRSSCAAADDDDDDDGQKLSNKVWFVLLQLGEFLSMLVGHLRYLGLLFSAQCLSAGEVSANWISGVEHGASILSRLLYLYVIIEYTEVKSCFIYTATHVRNPQ